MHTDLPDTTAETPRPRSRRPLTLAIVVVVAVAAAGAYWLADRAAVASRQEAVAARGADVMPFSLDLTTHVFRPRADGGVQTVTANDPNDTAQVDLIRAHLSDEAERFRNGDFSDPASIHGRDMPGLTALREHDGALAITYQQLPDGARITYETTDSALVDALHHWFDAQLRDHGEHARRD